MEETLQIWLKLIVENVEACIKVNPDKDAELASIVSLLRLESHHDSTSNDVQRMVVIR